MTDVSFRSAGYALMIQDNPDQNIQAKPKTYAPVAFGSKIFYTAQLKLSIYWKEFLAIYMAFLEFAYIWWETTKPTIGMTDNKSGTLFFHTKAIPPAPWNACEYVLQFNFKIGHIAGSVNTAVDFLFQTVIHSRGEDTSQNPGKYPNNTYQSDFSVCRWWRTIFLQTSRQ